MPRTVWLPPLLPFVGIDLALQTVTIGDLGAFHLLDIDLDIEAVAVPIVGDVRRHVTMDPAATPAGSHTYYSVVSVDAEGNRYAEYPAAHVEEIEWDLNGPGLCSFTIPIDDPAVDQLPLANVGTAPHREVQVWRNGSLLWWGVPVRRVADSQQRAWKYQAAGLLWYFTRRYVGNANRGNFVTNPGFESGTTDWTNTGVDAFTTPTERVAVGTQAAKLVNGTGGEDAYIYQQRFITATKIGLNLFLAAWVWIDPDLYISPAFGSRGLLLQRLTIPGGLASWAAAPLDDSTPRGVWHRLECTIWMPPDATDVIEWRLYAPEGTVYWDAVQVVAQESVAYIDENSPGGAGWDQVNIAKEVVKYAQGKGMHAHDITGTHNGKSDLEIATAGAVSGIETERYWDHAEHAHIYTGPGGSGVLDEWPQRYNGFDYDIEIGVSTRVFTTYYPRKGDTRDDLKLEWGRNIAAYSVSEDIAGTANQIVILGADDKVIDSRKSSREEGEYRDDAALGGLTLEHVEAAPTGSRIGQLDHLARVRGRQLKVAVVIPELTVHEVIDQTTGEVLQPLIGVLKTGDVIPVLIEDGDVQVDDYYRVVRIKLSPPTETLALTVNPEDVGLPS